MPEPIWNSVRTSPESKVIAWVKYSIKTNHLRILFQTNRLAHYDYHGVPANVAQGAFVAEKVEDWYNRQFRPLGIEAKKREYEIDPPKPPPKPIEEEGPPKTASTSLFQEAG